MRETPLSSFFLSPFWFFFLHSRNQRKGPYRKLKTFPRPKGRPWTYEWAPKFFSHILYKDPVFFYDVTSSLNPLITSSLEPDDVIVGPSDEAIWTQGYPEGQTANDFKRVHRVFTKSNIFAGRLLSSLSFPPLIKIFRKRHQNSDRKKRHQDFGLRKIISREGGLRCLSWEGRLKGGEEWDLLKCRGFLPK